MTYMLQLPDCIMLIKTWLDETCGRELIEKGHTFDLVKESEYYSYRYHSTWQSQITSAYFLI